jgi:hypothetical protein
MLGGLMGPRGFAIACALLIAASVGGAESSRSTCPAERLLPKLDSAFQTCKANRGTCSEFIDVLNQLLPRYDCRRPHDTAPVPAIWLAGDDRLEAYFSLLSKLKTVAARSVFGSSPFRDALDGHLAEEYFEKSIAVQMKLESKP